MSIKVKSSDSGMRRRACAVVTNTFAHELKVLLVKMRDPVTGIEFLVPPGGAIEDGETPQDTALRETFEETGYHIKLKEKSPVVARYSFLWAGVEYDCETVFFRCELQDPAAAPEKTHDASYVLGAEWLRYETAKAALSFFPEVQKATLACLADVASGRYGTV